MIILISGDTHTGKTLLAQKLLERLHIPYLSMDHLKMGLSRTKTCNLVPESDDEEWVEYLWPIVREMIKTCLENCQHLIVEGCYIPFSWKQDFLPQELEQIHAIWLIFSEHYIREHGNDIIQFEGVIERRKTSYVCLNDMIQANAHNLQQCCQHKLPYLLIDTTYTIDLQQLPFPIKELHSQNLLNTPYSEKSE